MFSRFPLPYHISNKKGEAMNKESLKAKALQLLGSIRFYIITFAWLADYLDKVAQGGFDLPTLFNQLSLWLGTVAGIGTIEKAIDAFTKKPALTPEEKAPTI